MPHIDSPHRPHHVQTGHKSCAHHHHSVEATLKTAEDLCRQKGLRLTEQRRAVLEALAESAHPCGAYDLIEALRTKKGRAFAPIAIYRALDFLKENDFIHRLESLNAFIACPHRHTNDEQVVFLICEACRHVEEAIAPAVSLALTTLAQDHGFTSQQQVMEIAGLCRACSLEKSVTSDSVIP